MNCVILRDCYVDRLYMKGEVHEVANSLVKTHPKNFREVGVSEEEAEEVLNTEHEQKMAKQGKPDKITQGMYWCSNCKTIHRDTSKLGKRHAKKYNL